MKYLIAIGGNMKRLFLALVLVLFCIGIVYAQTTGYIWTFEEKLEWKVTKHISSAFDGATTNAHGSLGEKPTYTVFTVTGDVIIKSYWGVVNTTLTDAGDAGRVEVGVVGNTALLMAQIAGATAGATLLEDGDIWHDAVSEAAGGSKLSGNNTANDYLTEFYINDGANIVEITSGADITAGQIDYYIIWAPAEAGARVAGAGTLS